MAQSPSAAMASGKGGQSAKKTASKKTAAKKNTDEFVAVAKEIEGLTRAKALKQADQIVHSVEWSYFKLGGILGLILSNAWYADEGYDKFADFVTERYGMQYRKAMYLINIYDSLIEAGIPYDKVEHLGWSKLKDLAKVIDADNVDDWIKIAEESTVLQLQQAIKAELKGEKQKTTTEESNSMATLTFKVFEDQKPVVLDAIKQVMEESGSESKGQALEHLCMNYMAGGKKSGGGQITAAKLKKLGLHKVLELVDTAFPDAEITVEAEGLEEEEPA